MNNLITDLMGQGIKPQVKNNLSAFFFPQFPKYLDPEGSMKNFVDALKLMEGENKKNEDLNLNSFFSATLPNVFIQSPIPLETIPTNNQTGEIELGQIQDNLRENQAFSTNILSTEIIPENNLAPNDSNPIVEQNAAGSHLNSELLPDDGASGLSIELNKTLEPGKSLNPKQETSLAMPSNHHEKDIPHNIINSDLPALPEKEGKVDVLQESPKVDLAIDNSQKLDQKSELHNETRRTKKDEIKSLVGSPDIRSPLSSEIKPNVLHDTATTAVVSDDQIVLDQIVQRFSLIEKEGRSHVQFQLEPKELGKVKMDMTIENDKVVLQFHVENERVKEIVQSHLPFLKDSLQDQGFSVHRFDVAFGGQGDLMGNNHSSQSFYRQNHSNRFQSPLLYQLDQAKEYALDSNSHLVNVFA